jgi:hypothetical protein
LATSATFKQLPKVNHRPNSKNSPHLATPFAAIALEVSVGACQLFLQMEMVKILHNWIVLFILIFKSFIFSKTHNDNANKVLTTALQCIKT